MNLSLCNFEKVKDKLPSRERFYSPLTNRKINEKEYEHVLNVWKNENNGRLARLVLKM